MKKKKLQLVLAAVGMLLILVALPLMTACAPEEEAPPITEKPISLTFATFYPPPPMIMGETLAEFTAELEKRSEGRVKVTSYFGESLLGGGEVYEGVVKGVADIGCSVFAYNRGRFPLMEVADLAGYPTGASAGLTSRISHELQKKFKPAELADTHVLWVFNFCPGNIDSTVPIHTLEDLTGLKIRATGVAGEIIEALGGVPVSMPMPDTYDALSKGLVQATCSSFENLYSYKMTEVAPYTTICTSVGYIAAFYMVMNLDSWNALPSDIQKILTELSEEYVDICGGVWTEGDRIGYQYGVAKGQTYIVLSPEEEARWVELAVKPLEEDYVARMEALGLPGREWLDYKHELMEKYSELYPPRPWVVGE